MLGPEKRAGSVIDLPAWQAVLVATDIGRTDSEVAGVWGEFAGEEGGREALMDLDVVECPWASGGGERGCQMHPQLDEAGAEDIFKEERCQTHPQPERARGEGTSKGGR